MSIIKQEKGFTLVELSIVIVVVGLLVAGIVAGVNIVKNAKLRTVISEIGTIKQAINVFKLQYDQLPGDMSNAYDYWGASCDSVASDCNGDGDNVIGWGPSGDSEALRTWQHMTLAEVFPGSFLGEGSGGSGSDAMYFSKSELAKYLVYTMTNDHVFKSGLAREEINLAIVVGEASTASNSIVSEAFTVQQAKTIDSKLDDGVANRGKIFATDGFTAGANACSAPRTNVGGSDFNSANFGSDTIACSIDVFLNR